MSKSISYIFPIYNESENISELYKILILETEKLQEYNFEFIFVNDGSTDDSLEKLIELNNDSRSDHVVGSRVKIINFSRNFGHQRAITAGIDYIARNSKSDDHAIIIMDADLQDPIPVSIEMIEKWKEGYQVVYGQRKSRDDGFLKKITASIFYRILNELTDLKIPLDTGDFRLMDIKIAKELTKMKEQNRYVRGLVSFAGFRQTAILFDRDKRYAGKTKYPFTKMLKLSMDGITGFSTIPLKLITHFGLFVSFISFVGIIYAIVLRLFFPEIVVSGWTTTLLSILFIGGVQIIMLGILGTYIGRIYTEVQGRPLYIIESVIE